MINGWRELLARTFEGFPQQDNVSPTWLVNPATRRRLKLDIYYLEAGIAIRFIGLTAKGQGRQSDWEALETEQRDQTRAELCRVNGVQLITVDAADDPLKQLDHLLSSLSRASRTLAQGEQPAAYKQKWMPMLGAARERANRLRTLLAKNPDQMMATWAESWRDREMGLSVGTPLPLPPPPKKNAKAVRYCAGQRVRHERFGEGVITAIAGSQAETMLSVLFDAAQERSFLATLVQDKLVVLD